MFCTLWPRNDEETRKCRDLGMDLERVFSLNDLVNSENVFFAATGVTNGELLQGVRYEGGSIRTQSIVMRSASGTIRYIEALHKMEKLEKISAIDY